MTLQGKLVSVFSIIQCFFSLVANFFLMMMCWLFADCFTN